MGRGWTVARLTRFKYQADLGTPFQPLTVGKSRGGSWTRTAKHHKQVHIQCANCGAIHELETDHIVPLHRGGTNEWTNLQSLCKPCHAAKTAREAVERAGRDFKRS